MMSLEAVSAWLSQQPLSAPPPAFHMGGAMTMLSRVSPHAMTWLP